MSKKYMYSGGGPRRRQQQFLEERYPMHAEEGEESQADVYSAHKRLEALMILRERKIMEIQILQDQSSSSDILSPQND